MHYFAALDVFFIAYSQSDLFGKSVILSLVLLSILCWIVLIQKISVLRKVRAISQAFQKAFELSKDPVLALDIANFPKPKDKNTPHPFASIFQNVKQKTIEVLNKNHYFIAQQNQKAPVYLTESDLRFLEAHAMTAISASNKSLEKNLYILSTIMALAPFLGLLGTVWGILVSFSGLHDGAGMSSNSAVLGGLSTALSTTVLGLLIAIPSLISYNYSKAAIRSYASDMDDFLSHILSAIELQYRKVE